MVEINLINQHKNVEVVSLQTKPAIGETINVSNGRWGIVSRIEHFDGGKMEVYIDEACNAKIVRRRL